MSTNKRVCECGNSIPATVTLDGKRRATTSRKRCFSCSPYKKEKRTWNANDAKRKECITLSLYKRGLTRKQELLQLSGGKCQKCGYNACKRALTFHHRDRQLKLFALTLNNLWSKPIADLLAEHAKCDLLCMNCHAEVEDALTGENIVDRVNTKYGTSF